MGNRIKSRRRIHLSSLMIPCLVLWGCVSNAQSGQTAARDRLADASHICRDTMALNLANVPYDMCVRSLIQNLPTADQSGLLADARTAKPGASESATLSLEEKSCAQFGVMPGAAEFATCASNLRASLNEADNSVLQ